MSDNKPLEPVRSPIVIRSAHDRNGNTGGILKGCYFLPSELKGFFNFFTPKGKTLATGISSAKPFPILLGDLAWTLECTIDDQDATGTWRNTAPGIGDEQDGSFQASSGPTLPADSDVESVLVHPSPPTGAIVIKKVFGDPDKDKLKDMYFLPSGINNSYNLYNKNGKWILSGIVSGTNFSFPHDSMAPNEKISWTVTQFVISDTAASGHWSNPDNPEGDQSGSFQASSGPGVDTETASAASAS